MFSIFYVLLIELMIMTLLNGFGLDTSNLSLFLIVLHAAYVLIFIYKRYNSMFILFSLGYILRLGALLWDLYARNIFSLVGSGADSEGFYRVIVNISNDISLIYSDVYGGLYTKILGFLAYFIGPNRLMLQYINVILGLFIILNAYEIFKLMSVEYKIMKISMILIVLMPLSIIHSSILLRERIITYLIILSLKNFIKWLAKPNYYRAILSLVLLLLSSVFHSGVIGLVVGLIFTFIFYNPKLRTYNFTTKSIVVTSLIALAAIVIYIEYSGVFLQKFSKLEDIEQLVATTTQGRGGSQYLTSFKVSNPIVLLLLIPVKIIYFLASPLPHYWRGLGDIISFFMDGIIYLYLFINGMRLFDKDSNDPVQITMFISLISVLVIFGIGINNAGTAMRHRNKIFEYIVIFWVLTLSSSSNKSKYNCESIQKK